MANRYDELVKVRRQRKKEKGWWDGISSKN